MGQPRSLEIGFAVLVVLLASKPGTALSQGLSEIPPGHVWQDCLKSRGPANAYYPEKAQRRRIEGATVAAQCRVGENGKATACVWVKSDMPGLGFEDAAVRLFCDKYRAALSSNAYSGPPIVELSLTFKLPKSD